MLRASSFDTQGLAVVGLTNLSMSDENCIAIVESGGLEPLVELSRSKNVKVQRLAMETISNLGPHARMENRVGIPYVEYGVAGPLVLRSKMIKLTDFEKWMHTPARAGQTVQCRLKRDKDTGFFDLYLDDDQHFKFVMSAQRKAKSKTGPQPRIHSCTTLASSWILERWPLETNSAAV